MEKPTYDDDGNLIIPCEEFYNQLDFEQIIFTLTGIEVKIVLLRHFGYTPKEIVKILKLRNISQYYQINFALRKKAPSEK